MVCRFEENGAGGVLVPPQSLPPLPVPLDGITATPVLASVLL